MNFYIGKGGDTDILCVFEKTGQLKEASELYNYLKEKELFKGNSGEIYSNISPSGNNFLILGLGEESKVTCESLRTASFNAGKELTRLKINSVHISVPTIGNMEYSDIVKSIVEGLLYSEYKFDKYLSEKKIELCIDKVYLSVTEGQEDIVQNGIMEAKNILEGVFLARDLTNEPAIYMTPKCLASSAKEQLEELGVKLQVYGEEEIKELGMDAFLAVTKGSVQEPQLIVMNYEGDPTTDNKLALVGKGLTYDSGGYSIKPTNSMITMQSDMAGSASVIGTMKAIAKSKLKKNVVGIVAACENMISGASYKPGDIIGSMSGKTIEIDNTDAEGRLTLADALWYAVDVMKASKVIDIATLTGACVIALGDLYTGAISNDKSLMESINNASELAGEPVWELPNNDIFKEQIEGTFADLKNTGGRGAGTITAGLFLQEFVNETPWVHLDIAGTSYMSSSSRGYLPKGATGVPVKTLYYLVKNMDMSK